MHYMCIFAYLRRIENATSGALGGTAVWESLRKGLRAIEQNELINDVNTGEEVPRSAFQVDPLASSAMCSQRS